MKTQKKKQKDQLAAEISKYKFQRVGIIKKVSFGLLPGTMLGAFATIHDGGFGMRLSMVDVETGLPVSYSMSDNGEYEKFFKSMGVIWHHELKGKHVLLLNNRDKTLVMYAEKVVPHKRLLESLKEDKK